MNTRSGKHCDDQTFLERNKQWLDFFPKLDGIFKAARDGDFKEVINIYNQSRGSIKETTEENTKFTVLHLACQRTLVQQLRFQLKQDSHEKVLTNQKLEIIKFLCKKFPEAIESVCAESGMPIHFLLNFQPPLETVKLLVESTENPEKILKYRTADDNTQALHIALDYHASDDVIFYLLNSYQDASKTITKKGYTALHYACWKFNFFSEDPSDFMAQKRILSIMSNNYPRAINLPHGETGWTPLHLLIQNESLNNKSLKACLVILLNIFKGAAKDSEFKDLFVKVKNELARCGRRLDPQKIVRKLKIIAGTNENNARECNINSKQKKKKKKKRKRDVTHDDAVFNDNNDNDSTAFSTEGEPENCHQAERFRPSPVRRHNFSTLSQRRKRDVTHDDTVFNDNNDNDSTAFSTEDEPENCHQAEEFHPSPARRHNFSTLSQRRKRDNTHDDTVSNDNNDNDSTAFSTEDEPENCHQAEEFHPSPVQGQRLNFSTTHDDTVFNDNNDSTTFSTEGEPENCHQAERFRPSPVEGQRLDFSTLFYEDGVITEV